MKTKFHIEQKTRNIARAISRPPGKRKYQAATLALPKGGATDRVGCMLVRQGMLYEWRKEPESVPAEREGYTEQLVCHSLSALCWGSGG